MNLNYYNMEISGDFGLEFKVPIWQDHLQGLNTEEILKFSSEIVENNYDYQDLNDDKDLTIWNKYNLFSIDNSSFTDLRKKIKLSYEKFVEIYEVEKKQKLYINGWFNILRKGGYVKKHCHSTHQNSYITGVFVLTDTTNSTTDFYLPQFEHLNDVGVVKIKNFKNNLIMFPQWLFHSVGPISEDLRITLAFDLFTEDAVEYYKIHHSYEDFPIKRAVPL